ncbi:MAG TPA: hypothetical protein VFV81_00005 [Verrucomicrobiae bacterium]|nr:hypothetical protein [Verrucomicrobiae bacterium]
MIPRLMFIAFAAFWVAMNVLLWRAEYGVHGGESPAPVSLVWKKILTAPDASLLSVYEGGERTGFCEFTTSVEQEMAQLDEDRPPPEGLMARAGYKIRLNGNISFGDFTNRIKFDGRVSFNAARQWREINVRLTTRNITAEIFAVATNENFRVKIYGNDSRADLMIRYADLNNPNALLHSIGRSLGVGELLSDFDLPIVAENSAALARSVKWHAHRERLLMGHEPVTAYRLETRVLEYPIVIHVSTLGEILRVELPNGVVARLDEWSKS